MDEEREKDLRKVKALREYYRRNFERGDYDENFMIWIEDILVILNTQQELTQEQGE